MAEIQYITPVSTTRSRMWFVLVVFFSLEKAPRMVRQCCSAVAATTPVAVKLESSDVTNVVTCKMLIPRAIMFDEAKSAMGDSTRPAIRNAMVRTTVIAVMAKKPIVIHKYFLWLRRQIIHALQTTTPSLRT